MVKRWRRGERGFTIVELMLVVVIIGILVAIAIPFLYDYRDQRIGNEATRSITQQLRGLRNLATTTNRAMTVYVFPGDGGRHAGGQGRVAVYPSAGADCITPPAATLPDPNLSVDLGALYPNDNVQIVKLSPTTGTNPALAICLRPDGSVVDLTTQGPLLPDETSATECTGEAYQAVGPTQTWPAICDKAGVACMRIAYVNNDCPDACLTTCDDGLSHVGSDHIITLTFAGEARMVQ